MSSLSSQFAKSLCLGSLAGVILWSLISHKWKDFVAPLRSGDKLEFKVGDASAGTFSVSDLPQNDAVLLALLGHILLYNSLLKEVLQNP